MTRLIDSGGVSDVVNGLGGIEEIGAIRSQIRGQWPAFFLRPRG
ncbi:MAG: hypothetical protein ACUVTN_12735 [Thermodesulfobacteriota bacterium]